MFCFFHTEQCFLFVLLSALDTIFLHCVLSRMELSLRKLTAGLLVRRAAIQLLRKFPNFSPRGQWRGGIVFFAWLKWLHHTIHEHLLLQQNVSDLWLYFKHFYTCHSFLVVQNRNSKNTHNCAVTSPDPYSLLPNCCPVTELTATSKFNSKQPRRNKPRKGQRRRTFTCSHLSWIKKSESEMSDIETSSEFLLLTCLNLWLFFVIVLLHFYFILLYFFVFRLLCV